MLSKIVLILLLNVFVFASDSCISKSYLNGKFNDIKKLTNVWDNNLNNWKKEISPYTNLFPSCVTNDLNFVQYSHRIDLKDIILVQYIFKGNNSSFKSIINNIINDSEFKTIYKNSYQSIKSNYGKQLIVEFNNNTTQETITFDGELNYSKELNIK